MGKAKIYGWAAAIVIFVVLMIVTPAIPQSEEYHNFADQRKLFLGIPNTLNVISNFPFLVVGIAGLILCLHGNYFRLSLRGEVWGWSCFFVGVAAVAFGSSYYHLMPNDATLVWDRLPIFGKQLPTPAAECEGIVVLNHEERNLPDADSSDREILHEMTVAFTSIIAIFIIERIDEKTGIISIIPLVMVGVLSILYWSFFDDLRPYALVQFVPCIIIPLMAILMPPMYTHSTYWLWAAGFYLLAKVAEAEDKLIYKWTHHIISGHTLKHLFAAIVPVFLTLMLAKRTVEPERKTLLQIWRIRWVRVKDTHFEAASLDCEYVPVKPAAL